MLLPTTLIATLLLAFSFVNQASAKEAFLILTQSVEGDYTLHFLENVTAGWKTLQVPKQLKNIEDVDFNYISRRFYFSVSSPPEIKGVWNGGERLDDLVNDDDPSHKFKRRDSQPQKILLYPEYNYFFLYDDGYDMVIGLNMSETQQLYSKSYFQDVERIEGNFFLDKESNQLIGFANESRTIYQTSLKESKARRIGSVPVNASKLLAFDSNRLMAFYCNGGMVTMSIANKSALYTSQFACIFPFIVSNSKVYVLDSLFGKITMDTYDENGFHSSSSSQPSVSVKLPIIPSNAQVKSFKRYEYSDKAAIRCGKKCDQICVPDVGSGEPVCVCSDFFTLKADNSSCSSNKIEQSAITILESTSPFETAMMWFLGDPKKWIERPQRERAMQINSRILAMTSDFTARRTYSVENRLRQIFSFYTDGTNVNLSPPYNQISPNIKSIAYDWVGNNILWYDPTFQWLRIVPLNYNQSSDEVPYKTVVVLPNLEGYSLSVDASAGYIFFLDQETATTEVRVVRCLMDGSDARVFAQTFNESYFDPDFDDSNSNNPLSGSLTADPYSSRVWIAFVNYTIAMNYDGGVLCSSKMSLFDDFGNSKVASIGIWNSSIAIITVTDIDTERSMTYFYEIAPSDSKTCLKSSTPIYKRAVNGEFRGMNIYQEPPTISNFNCSALGCSQMCTNVNGTATCICRDGYEWNETSKTCSPDFAKPAVPVMVYAKNKSLCYRPVDGGVNPRNQQIEFCSPKGEDILAIEPDDMSNGVFFQKESSNSLHYQRLKSYPKPGKSGLQYENDTQIARLRGHVLAMAFDDLARNLYVATDHTDQSLVVMREGDSNFPKPLRSDGVQIQSLAIDHIRRTLYWVAFSHPNNTTNIYRGNLQAGNPCPIVTLPGAFTVQLQIAHANDSLYFLQSTGYTVTLNWIQLSDKQSLANSSCKNQTYTPYPLPAAKIYERFAVYQKQLKLVSPLGDLYTSTDLVKSTINLGDGASTFSIWHSFLSKATDDSRAAEIDKCASQTRGGCEQLCLANQCYCMPGMDLLPDNRTCKPRVSEIHKDGAIIVTDEFHHKIYAIPLFNGAILATTIDVESNLSTFSLHSKSRPRAVAYDTISGKLYYSGVDRNAIFRLNPSVQGRLTAKAGLGEEYFTYGSASGLFISPSSPNLWATFPGQIKTYNLITRKPTVYHSNASVAFLGVTVDVRTNYSYVAALSAVSDGPLLIYRLGVDKIGDPPTVFEGIPAQPWPAKTPSAELAIDSSTNLLYISFNGLIMTKRLSNMSAAAQPFYVRTGGVEKERMYTFMQKKYVYAGLNVVGDGLLLASEWIIGGIHVYRTDNNQLVNKLGENVFYGLGAMIVHNPAANAAIPSSIDNTVTVLSMPSSVSTTTTANTASTSTASGVITQSTTSSVALSEATATETKITVSTSKVTDRTTINVPSNRQVNTAANAGEKSYHHRQQIQLICLIVLLLYV